MGVTSTSKKTSLLPLLWFAAALTFVIAQLRLVKFCADDAFIHFRIARNFLTSGVPYFNPAEAVMSTSSPLWTLVLTALFGVVGVKIGAVALLNALITASAAAIWARLGSLLTGEGRLRESLFFIAAAAGIFSSSVQLMETPLALLLLGAGAYLYFRNDPISFAVLTLGCFTRSELLVFLLVFVFENIVYRRIRLRVMVAAILGVALPFVLFEVHYFHTLIPQTVKAKAVIYHLTMSEFFTFAVAGLLGKYLFYTSPLFVVFFFTSLIVLTILRALYGMPGREHAAQDHRAQVLLAGLLFLFLGYLIKRVYLFPWYMPLLLVPLSFVLLRNAFVRKERLQVMFAAVVIFPIYFSFARDLAAVWNSKLYSEADGGERAQQYLEIGATLRARCVSCSVMAAEVGALGFGFEGKILDAAGLISPEALAFHEVLPRSSSSLGGGIPAQFVAAANPDFIVGLDSFLAEVTISPVAAAYRTERIGNILLLTRHTPISDHPRNALNTDS